MRRMEHGVAVARFNRAACGNRGRGRLETALDVIEHEGLGFGLHRGHTTNGDDDILDASAFGEQDVFERLSFSTDLRVGGVRDVGWLKLDAFDKPDRACHVATGASFGSTRFLTRDCRQQEQAWRPKSHRRILTFSS